MSRQTYLLQTRRLGMRRYKPDDAIALSAVFADPIATKFYPAMITRPALVHWINWNLHVKTRLINYPLLEQCRLV